MTRILVAVGLIAGFAALCWDSSHRLAQIYPSIGICDSDPPRYRGREVWLQPFLVVESSVDHFRLQVYEWQVRVFTPDPPKVGSHVMVYGKYRELQTVDAITWREESGYAEKRRGVILVSLVVLGIWAWVFWRTFVWRNGAIHPR